MIFILIYYIIYDAIILTKGDNHMKKIAKMISVFLAMVFVFAGMSVSVYAAGEDNLTITVYDDFAAVTSCRTYASGVIDIPSSKDGVPVVMISNYAFEDCSKITQVNIPESVTKVGDNAFESCTSLQKVVFTGTSCTVGTAAFKYCSALTEITLPSALKNIPDEAFYGCTALASLSIPDTVEVIGKEAFRICSGITQFDIPASVNVIKKNAFLGCSAVTAYNVAEGNSVYSSVDGVLYGPYESAYDTDISSPVTDKTLIQYPAAKAGTSYAVQSGTVIIGDYAFSGNKNIASVTLPAGVKAIDAYAFNECSSLSQINFPSTLTEIGSQAFGRCSSLKSVTIPASVTDFDSAFYMSGLTSVAFENGVKKISAKSFEGCDELASATIPSSVEAIELGAFYGCSSLGDVEIPSTVASIGREVFKGCDNITLIVEEDSAAHTYAVDNSIFYELKKDGSKDEPTTGATEKPSETTKPSTTEPTTKPSVTKKTIASISVDKLPNKTSYYYKETVNTAGMQVEVIYSDGSSEIIKSGFEVSPAVCTERGVQTVTVEYEGFTDDFQISVSFAWWQWIIWILLLGFLWY